MMCTVMAVFALHYLVYYSKCTYKTTRAFALFSRYLTRIKSRHPPLPQYMDICDIDLLLFHFDLSGHNENLKYKDL